jgi:hypothetical protein
MKRFTLGAAILIFAGCSAATEPVGNMIRDKQFDQYKTTLDQLESDYLQKTITYAQYLEKKKAVEDEYQGKIDGRRELIQNHNEPKSAAEMAP